MLYIDLKYLHFLQPKLVGFVRKKDHLFNFKCPLCGDSHTNKKKMRGYIYAWKGELKMHCHNCGASHRFSTFLKMVDTYLYEQYRVEVFKEKYGTSFNNKTKEEPLTPTSSNTAAKLEAKKGTPESIFYSICARLDTLPKSNKAVEYCRSRQIPKVCYKRLFYIDDTMLLKKLVPDLDIKFSEQRLVIPFFDREGALIGLTCRALNPKSKLRYLTVKLNDTPQVFGMECVDPTKTIYVVEGPIDSLFIPNAIAVTGTSFGKVEAVLSELNIAKDQVILIMDNQPRNVELTKLLKRLIERGYNVVIWDISDSLGKDINSLIMDANMTPLEVFTVIKRCATRGMEAMMKFIQWKKC